MWFKVEIDAPNGSKATVGVEGEYELAGALRVCQALGCVVKVSVIEMVRR